jgi:hypothetical protein
MQLALGGPQKISAIHDFDEIVRAETWNRQGRPLGTVRKRVRWIRPNYLRIDQSGPYDTYVLFCDGRGGWEIMPDKSVKDLAGGELTFARLRSRSIRSLTCPSSRAALRTLIRTVLCLPIRS